ncbi:otitis media-associated H10 [Bacillus thuringiensis]|uniref:Otitis media-associated H10 n=1 Tax=Bacillus thuringiensis TaxID=1428 RepID=A0A9X7FZF5_BACTU|nr:FtsK/SpoIIIE domain-containing protein [Bacillus thuringiensis]PFT78466.1 otitis media-associated H10 [Bacillus thuringiensis]
MTNLFRFITRSIKKRSIKDDFKLVSYTGDKNHINALFWMCVIGSLISFWLVVLLAPLFPTINFFGLFYTTTDFILLPVLVYLLFNIWKFYYKQRNKPSKIAEKLLYFIKANKLYETEMIEKKDSENNIERVKVVTNSAVFGFCEDEETLIVRGYKNADVFNDKISSLDTGLSALVGLTVYNKVDKISYCDYYFRKKQDERIVMASNQGKAHNDSICIPFNSNLTWNVLKQPHLLLAGVTGGGKTTFLNYLIIEMKKMRATVYICDPKRSDLSSIQHFWGKEYVARLTREVKEQMMERFAIYKENPENFVYGASYVDYGLEPIFLVFDELGAFRAGADKKTFTETMSNLTEVVLKGREMGVFVILATQQPNASNIPTELRDNLSVRIALGNMSNEAYRMVFGDLEGLETVSGQGTGYIFLDGLGWSKPKYLETPFLDYKEFDFIAELKYYS